jgi:hypothetical protein
MLTVFSQGATLEQSEQVVGVAAVIVVDILCPSVVRISATGRTLQRQFDLY